MKIYTKTGDEGTTGLLGGDRIQKTSARIIAIGEVDELNATLGICRALSLDSELDDVLASAQNWLFDLGAELACPPGGKFTVESLSRSQIESVEASIDGLTAKLPPLKNFILPGGTLGASHLHLARAVCRRAERSVLDLHATEPVREEVRQFLNRLSDWLFVAARTANAVCNVPDIAWKKSEVQ